MNATHTLTVNSMDCPSGPMTIHIVESSKTPMWKLVSKLSPNSVQFCPSVEPKLPSSSLVFWGRPRGCEQESPMCMPGLGMILVLAWPESICTTCGELDRLPCTAQRCLEAYIAHHTTHAGDAARCAWCERGQKLVARRDAARHNVSWSRCLFVASRKCVF